MAVQAVELGEVEARRRAPDAVEIEPLDRPLGRDDLLVAAPPAQAQQIVAQRLGQVAHVAVGRDAERAVALRQLGAVGSVDQRDVGEFRHPPAERLEQLGLAEGVGQMVVAADHVGDFHVVIVDHDREHVGRRPVGAQQHHVVELVVGHRDLALDQVVEHGLTAARRLEADDRRHARRRLGRVAVAPASVVEHPPPLGARPLAQFLQFLGRAVAVVGLARLDQAARDLGVVGGAGELMHRLAVPVELEPAQAVEDGVDRRLGRALAVGVLDAEAEQPAVVAREQPVEQRGARPADVQEAGRRGRETGDYRRGGRGHRRGGVAFIVCGGGWR